MSIRVPLFSNQRMLGAIFAQIFRVFQNVLRDFARILWDFAQIFTKWKLLGLRLHPHLLHKWDGEFSKRLFSTISEQDFNQNVGEVANSIYLVLYW